MLLRLPWLLSRKRLLAALLIDTTLFSLLYLGWFRLNFASWPEFSLPLTWMLEFWLVSSYVLGRYHQVADRRSALLLSQLLRTFLVLLLSIGVYLAYHWLTATTLGAQDGRSFLLPFLLMLGLASALMQLLQSSFLLARTPQECWLVLGSAALTTDLRQRLAWSRIPAQLLVWQPAHHATLTADATLMHPSTAGVVVADLQNLPQAQLQQLLMLQNSGLSVLTPLGWCERVLQRFPPELFSGAELIRGEFAIPQCTIQMRLKRLGDVVVSAGLLLLTMPLLLLAALCIRLGDAGPMFYSQIRSGLGGIPYRVWKLRSMRVDAERHGAQWVGSADPRITPIGRLLRLTRIDELPQLWAVLCGQMSLIGPRPERPEFEAELEQQIPHYLLRHWLRPGLSGWAQVNYPYGASIEDAANKLSYDLYYLRNFSFWLDLLILFKTMRLVFNAQGAVPNTQVDTSQS